VRVAFYTRFPRDPGRPKGGIESVAVVLAPALARSGGLDVQVITLDCDEAAPRREQHDGYEVHRLPAGRWPQILDLHGGPGYRAIRACVASLSPDVLHSHETHGLTLRCGDVPHVFTVHGFDHANLVANDAPWAGPRAWLWRRMERRGLRRQRHIISISPYVRAMIEPQTRARIFDIDNPVDASFFEIPRAAERGRVLCVGWINPRKNTLGAVEALAEARRLGADAHLVVAGQPQEPAYYERVVARVQALGLTKHVEFLGHVSYGALREELGRAEVFLLPSLQENAPMAISEAMAAGVPVIASNRCGMPFMVEEDGSGYLVDPEAPAQIGARIAALVDDAALAARFAERGRQIALERFHPDAVVAKTVRAYETTIAEQHRTGVAAARPRAQGEPPAGAPEHAPRGKSRWRALVAWMLLAAIYGGIRLLCAMLPRPRRRGSRAARKLCVIGTFHNPGWYRAHVAPLAASADEVLLITDGPQTPLRGVRFVWPPKWAARLLTRAGAKFLCMLLTGIRERPDLYMGYHILPGAGSALVVGRLLRRPSVYQMTGGPIEFEGGGDRSESWVSGALRGPSRTLERLALACVAAFDGVIVRGSRAREYLAKRGMRETVFAVTGSVAPAAPLELPERAYDLVFVGRLAPFKQPEQFVEVVARVARGRPALRAAVVGDGPMLAALQVLARARGVFERIDWLGQRADAERIVGAAKVFVLTSRSEGLSIAMAEAMAAGTVPVVADVGELGDLVRDGESGFLIPPGDVAAYAARAAALLADEATWSRMSAAARRAAQACSVEAVAARWRECFDAVCGSPAERAAEKGEVAQHAAG